MTPFAAEFLGTALVITIGNGVVANVVLPNTKGNNGGLISIVFGWMIAVFIGVYVTSSISGGHLNPAVTIALASASKFDWALVPSYILAQLLGAMFGPSSFGWYIKITLMSVTKHRRNWQFLVRVLRFVICPKTSLRKPWQPCYF